MAEPARSRAELSEPARRRRGARAVPQDWFLDPVDGDSASAAPARRLSGLSDTESVDFQDA